MKVNFTSLTECKKCLDFHEMNEGSILSCSLEDTRKKFNIIDGPESDSNSISAIRWTHSMEMEISLKVKSYIQELLAAFMTQMS